MMLRIHCMQQWFTLSAPAMQAALHGTPLLREFAGLGGFSDQWPHESTILRFRHLFGSHKVADHIRETVHDLLRGKGSLLRPDAVVDATLIGAPRLTKTILASATLNCTSRRMATSGTSG
jgi:IS5 family transposase